MASLFGRKEKKAEKEAVKTPKATKTKVEKTEVVEEGAALPQTQLNKATVIVRPHVTEKAAVLTDSNVYTFVVEKNATKPQIVEAVKALYKKTPLKVRVTQKDGKRVMRRSGPGRKSSLKKAYVYLKKGETLDIL